MLVCKGKMHAKVNHPQKKILMHCFNYKKTNSPLIYDCLIFLTLNQKFIIFWFNFLTPWYIVHQSDRLFGS